MTFSGSVVAKTNFTCGGGSSTSFRSALNPCGVTMWASSKMNTLNRSRAGAYTARSRRSRASSTPLWLAASISTTSSDPGPPVARSRHDAHCPHGVDVGPCSQLRHLARILAEVVFPHPRGPEKRYAWLTRPLSRAAFSGPVTWSCPITSLNVSGL